MKLGEVSLGVLESILVVPEVSGHTGKWLGAHELTVFIKYLLTCVMA